MSLRDRVDPELLPGVEAFRAALGPRGLFGIEDIAERRATFAAMMAQAAGGDPPDDGVQTRDLQIPGPEGAPEVTVRVYTPPGADGPLPGVLYIHGGGLIIGSIATEDPIARATALAGSCVVVSVEYRLAPETRHPGPVEDCYAALRWLAANTGELGVDPARIAVYGASAGGCLAAATALLARDRGGPALMFQALIFPMLDDRMQTPSALEIQDLGIFDGWASREGFEALLGDACGTDAVDAYAAPARATDLSGLPPAFVDVGGLDALRDEAVDYATRLMQAGVPAEMHVYPGVYHGGDLFVPQAEISRRIGATRVDALRRALHG